MTAYNRRTALQKLGFATLVAGMGRMSLAGDKVPVSGVQIDQWLQQLYAVSGKLGASEVSGLHWQEEMDRLYGSVPMGGLKERLDLPNMQKQILSRMSPGKGELFQRVMLPGSSKKAISGAEPARSLVTKVAHIRKGRSIPPHGHSNMASAFLCLSGEFQVRQYDRMEVQPDHMIVRQTVDAKAAGPGTWSSISDYRNNVHWLTAKTDDCFLFTCKLIHLEEARESQGRINIDVHRAEALGTNTLRAPLITAAAARELY